MPTPTTHPQVLSSATLPSSGDWTLTDPKGTRSISLLIESVDQNEEGQQFRASHAFPYSRFCYAGGTSREIKLIFQTHEVVINGEGLDDLLRAISAQQVAFIKQPTQNEAKFGRRGLGAQTFQGGCVTTIEVTEL